MARNASLRDADLTDLARAEDLARERREARRREREAAAVSPDAARLPEIVYRERSMHEGKALVAVNARECELEWYYRRKLIGMIDHEAGLRFRADWEIAQISAARALDMERVAGGSYRGIGDVQADAIDRVRRALKALGAVGATLVVNVCGDGRSVAEMERLLGWPQRYGMQRFREALNDLAEHYGMKTRSAVVRYSSRA